MMTVGDLRAEAREAAARPEDHHLRGLVLLVWRYPWAGGPLWPGGPVPRDAYPCRTGLGVTLDAEELLAGLDTLEATPGLLEALAGEEEGQAGHLEAARPRRRQMDLWDQGEA